MHSRVVACCKSLFLVVLSTLSVTAALASVGPDPNPGLTERKRTLATRGIQYTPQALARGLEHPDPSARSDCAYLLGYIGTENEVDPLKDFIEKWRYGNSVALQSLDEIARRLPEEKQTGLHNYVVARAIRNHKDAIGKDVGEEATWAEFLALHNGPMHPESILRALEHPKKRYKGFRALSSFLRSRRPIPALNGKPVDWVTPLIRILKDQDGPWYDRSSASGLLANHFADVIVGDALRDALAVEKNGDARKMITFQLDIWESIQKRRERSGEGR